MTPLHCFVLPQNRGMRLRSTTLDLCTSKAKASSRIMQKHTLGYALLQLKGEVAH